VGRLTSSPGDDNVRGDLPPAGAGGFRRVGVPGIQPPFRLQPLEALGEDLRGDPGDLAEQVIEPLGPPSSDPATSSVYRSPALASASASGDEPFSRSAMSGS